MTHKKNLEGPLTVPFVLPFVIKKLSHGNEGRKNVLKSNFMSEATDR
jgi:hypothetical protein